LREVVGVVGDVKERGLDVLEPVSMLYEPVRQDETGTVALVVRSDGDTSLLVPAITNVQRTEVERRRVRLRPSVLESCLQESRLVASVETTSSRFRESTELP